MTYTAADYKQMDKILSYGQGQSERNVFSELYIKVHSSLKPELRSGLEIGLDIGTVTGFYPVFMHFECEVGHGMNIDPCALKFAETQSSCSPYINNPMEFIEGDMLKIPFEDMSLDMLTIMTGTFSHVSQGQHINAIKEFSRVLSDNGYLVISDWNMAAKNQNFLNLPYNQTEKNTLRKNNLSYSLLIEAIRCQFDIKASKFFSDNTMYMIFASRKPRMT